ncbi:MAG TPA: L-ribulose-5-phosphate 4-epimerase AraD [Polyangiaceae bacterium]|nr:L-ribulose-5-phosphate 4-epimerase AraD [Polyangiaceae bacterium]
MKTGYQDLKEQAWRANLEIPSRGLAIYTFGNVSALDAERAVFAIKPSGVAYERLTVSDMVVVDLEANVVEGTLRPSSDTRTHAALYRAFPGIGGIVHTHSTYATAWAQACKPIPLYGTTHADHLAEDVPCTELMTADAVALDYEAETGTQIIDCFRTRDPNQTPMVLVAGHGVFTWGQTAEKAVYHAVVLEELAKMAAITHALAPSVGRLPEHLIRKHFERKHGKRAYYGQ